jgi:hypothetical protein
MTGGYAIEIEGLRFDYPGVRALDEVSCTVACGSVTALGPARSDPAMSFAVHAAIVVRVVVYRWQQSFKD